LKVIKKQGVSKNGLFMGDFSECSKEMGKEVGKERRRRAL